MCAESNLLNGGCDVARALPAVSIVPNPLPAWQAVHERFCPTAPRGLDTFIDSSWGTRVSISGCLVFYHGCVFHWFSKMQRSVSLSSAEAEYILRRNDGSSRRVIFLRDLLLDLGVAVDAPSVIQSDSKSAIDMYM